MTKLNKDKYRYKVEYYINGTYLYEYCEETKITFKYDLISKGEGQKELFKTRFRINTKRDYCVKITCFDMYYLHKWGWL